MKATSLDHNMAQSSFPYLLSSANPDQPCPSLNTQPLSQVVVGLSGQLPLQLQDSSRKVGYGPSLQDLAHQGYSRHSWGRKEWDDYEWLNAFWYRGPFPEPPPSGFVLPFRREGKTCLGWNSPAVVIWESAIRYSDSRPQCPCYPHLQWKWQPCHGSFCVPGIVED